MREGRFARVGWLCAVVALCAALMPAAGWAQDVAEAARQEQARKAAQGARQSHIYTNEDLQKAEILSQEERAALEAKKKNSDGAAESVAAAKPAEAKPAASATISNLPVVRGAAADPTTVGAGEKIAASESLGETARRYRRQKASRQAERASVNSPASQFHLNVAAPALAEIAPRRAATRPVPWLPVAREIRPRDVQPNIQPRNSVVVAKRDPFRRQLALGGLEIAKNPVMSGFRTAAPNASAGGTAARQILVPSASESKAAWRRIGKSSDLVAVAPRSKNSFATIAGGVPVVSEPTSSLAIVPTADGIVVVRDGDSLWSLSRRYSGFGARWHEWLAANPGIGEKRLRPGMRLVRPGGEAAIAVGRAANGESARKTITVRGGDSFWKIAAERYGDGRLWSCVARANPRLRDVAKIYPGQTLKLPAACLR